MKKWWIGCSGFYYKGWKEKFYPPGLSQRKWFEYYCQFFNTVELNVTFYRLPKVDVLAGWHSRSPAEFRFTVKAPRLITHYKRFNNVYNEIQGFYDLVTTGLSDKLGCILFQLHPRIVYSTENLERIITSLDDSFVNVLEFRHPSWWNDTVIRMLQHHHITFCGISYPELPETVVKTSQVLYYRFHGVPELYLSSYTTDQLQEVANAVHPMRGLTEVYAYFNNDIQVAAVENARALQKLVANAKSSG
jgi:uncharacterized protein YecE (DUF72 family)